MNKTHELVHFQVAHKKKLKLETLYQIDTPRYIDVRLNHKWFEKKITSF